MKTGRKLDNLVSEILRQSESKRDFLTPAKRLHFNCDGPAPRLEVNFYEKTESFPLQETGHQQLAERLEISQGILRPDEDGDPLVARGKRQNVAESKR